MFTESAASYLVMLAEGEQARSSTRLLAAALPGWITGCASHLNVRAVTGAFRDGVYSMDCGMLVQFVYDFAARSKSRGRESLYDTWRALLSASFRRGDFGVSPVAFLASSGEAHRVVKGLLDGTVDWNRFSAEIEGFGVNLNMIRSVPVPEVEVRSLAYRWD
jgi:hypothetical protein